MVCINIVIADNCSFISLRMGPTKICKGLEHLLQGKAGGAGPVQPQEQMTERGLINVHQYLKRGVKGMEPGSAPYCKQ